MSYSNLIKLYFEEKQTVAKNFPINELNKLVVRLFETYDKDGTIYTMANGGATSVSEGFSTDIATHPFVLEDKTKTTEVRRIKFCSLTSSSGLLTGISNDIGFENIFKEQLKNFLRSKNQNQNDTLIAFSGSGNSKNVINAIEYAKSYGVFTCCVSGRGGGKAKEISDLSIVIPGSSEFPGQTGPNDNNFHIEDFQGSITHILTGLLKMHVEKK
tara:strand:+ start:1246 stop:1887 length:642 start_codon:yes stop_codon:yes gene_type:complete